MTILLEIAAALALLSLAQLGVYAWRVRASHAKHDRRVHDELKWTGR
ncbi:MAG TPA: hypothetical protein VFQ22_05295 [Longimicrobiales bacterium]|nr:hypothetical protein [Longimicrobiales bacterium]